MENVSTQLVNRDPNAPPPYMPVLVMQIYAPLSADQVFSMVRTWDFSFTLIKGLNPKASFESLQNGDALFQNGAITIHLKDRVISEEYLTRQHTVALYFNKSPKNLHDTPFVEFKQLLKITPLGKGCLLDRMFFDIIQPEPLPLQVWIWQMSNSGGCSGTYNIEPAMIKENAAMNKHFNDVLKRG